MFGEVKHWRLGIKQGERIFDDVRLVVGQSVALQGFPEPRVYILTDREHLCEKSATLLFEPHGAGYRLVFTDEVTDVRVAEHAAERRWTWVSRSTLEQSGRIQRHEGRCLLELPSTHGSMLVGDVQVIFQFFSTPAACAA